MDEVSNIFDNPPTLSSDEALEKLRHQLSPKESYYCAVHLVNVVDTHPDRNYSVGSTKRYLMKQNCAYCSRAASFIVTE